MSDVPTSQIVLIMKKEVEQTQNRNRAPSASDKTREKKGGKAILSQHERK